jgi:hypothetical protein
VQNVPSLLRFLLFLVKCETETFYIPRVQGEREFCNLKTSGHLDRVFSNQKSKFGSSLEGLAIEDVGLF